MRPLYSLAIILYYFALRLVSLFNQKARDWFYGRRELFTKLDEVFTRHYADENPSPVIWIHCASLGEYEQGRPIIQELKKRFPGFVVLLTFFSPSGFNNKASNSEADHVFYLPIDTQRNARKFVRMVSPALAIFVKYEFWFNYLHELQLNKIPTYTISAIFRADQHFFKWYGGWFRKHLRNLNRIFVQDQESAELLNFIEVNNVIISGDTRFDRVSRISEQQVQLPVLDNFIGYSRVLVAGSTWPPDEELLKKLYSAMNGALKLVIAPHEVTPQHLADISSRFKDQIVYYSQLSEKDSINRNILIIDTIGLLSQIYRYADIAYIGGGFGVGIHNTLEAAVYGVPVIFGPNYHKFREARELIFSKAAVSIKDADELINEVSSFIDSPEKLEMSSLAASQYVRDRIGATEKIMGEIKNLFYS